MSNPEPGAWRKSSYSNSFSNCVEAGRGTCGMVHVRDSKDPDGPVLTFTGPEWDAFVRGVRAADPGLR